MTFTYTNQPASDVRAGAGLNAVVLDASIGWSRVGDDVQKQDMESAGFECGGRTS